MDSATLAQMKADGFVHELKEAGIYTTAPTEPTSFVKSVKANVILEQADIENPDISITALTLEQSTDGGQTWQAIAAAQGWRGSRPVLSSVVPDGTELQEKTYLKDPFGDPDGETITVEVEVPKFKTITAESNPDDFSKMNFRPDPGMTVFFNDENDKAVERSFRITYELAQSTKVGTIISTTLWQP